MTISYELPLDSATLAILNPVAWRESVLIVKTPSQSGYASPAQSAV